MRRSHESMMKDVPIVGWDVAFTDEGVYLLEVNLSCNFFRGNFNIPDYISFVAENISFVEKIKNERGSSVNSEMGETHEKSS